MQLDVRQMGMDEGHMIKDLMYIELKTGYTIVDIEDKYPVERINKLLNDK